MPRLSPSLLLQACRISPFLPMLLRECRTIQSAKNELRWIQEAVEEKKSGDGSRRRIFDMCVARGKGVPLQYVLGTQPFGELEILCRRGVLIPRPETEAYTTHLAQLLLENKEFKKLVGSQLRILDLCTGTGCISLHVYSLMSKCFPDLEVRGIDISGKALSLSKENRAHNIKDYALPSRAASQVTFEYGDVLGNLSGLGDWDVIISNPPYISSLGFNKDTARSVRNWEPKLALVPPTVKNLNGVEPADIFYPKIFNIGRGAKVVVTEVADLQQAKRVATLAVRLGMWRTVEIWRDWPDGSAEDGQEVELIVDKQRVIIKGTGHGRSVVCWS